MRRLLLGTRGSALARVQAEIVLQALHEAHPDVQVDSVIVRTEGDRRLDVSLEEAGGQGIFVKDIEKRLLAHEIDLAVHSLKDMPATLPEGLSLAALLPRGDPRDALVTRGGVSLEALAPRARVGSDSRRRAVQLLALRPDLEVAPIRGNVDSRVAKVEAGEYDAVLLAAAGLQRLGLLHKAARVFEPDEMLPAPGQAVLAVECRADDEPTLSLLSVLDDAATRAAVTAERAFLRRLGAGCRLPVGAYATVEGDGLHLRALLGGDDGAVRKAELEGRREEAEAVGIIAAETLLMQMEAAANG